LQGEQKTVSFESIGPAELERLLPMRDAIEALREAFGSGRMPDAPLRSHVSAGEGELLVMPVSDEDVGVKLVTVNRNNPGRGKPLIQGVYVLFSGGALEPIAVFDGAALTKLRTAAVSGLATSLLAREDARRLVVFGAGAQARAHLEAMVAVRPIEWIGIVEKEPDRAKAAVERARAMGAHAEAVEADAVAEADIVCTCTTSKEPVFDGSLLAEGTHVNAIGAYKPDAREIDDEAVRRARVVVELREAAMEEAGDLLIPLSRGVIDEDHVVAELGDVARGQRVRTSPDDVTLFESVGIAFEDLVVAKAALWSAPAFSRT
jgi:ornithine cyclodeaminase